MGGTGGRGRGSLWLRVGCGERRRGEGPPQIGIARAQPGWQADREMLSSCRLVALLSRGWVPVFRLRWQPLCSRSPAIICMSAPQGWGSWETLGMGWPPPRRGTSCDQGHPTPGLSPTVLGHGRGGHPLKSYKLQLCIN